MFFQRLHVIINKLWMATEQWNMSMARRLPRLIWKLRSINI
jgi:hypothetical protein